MDNEDELKILVGYKKFLVNRFKEIEEERKQARLSLKDKLLSIWYVDKIVNNDTNDVTNDELIYDICGYHLHSRSEVLECCNCKPFLKTEESELPDTFASVRIHLIPVSNKSGTYSRHPCYVNGVKTIATLSLPSSKLPYKLLPSTFISNKKRPSKNI